MNYNSFKCSEKEYLGFCEQKGFIYSVKVATDKYSIVALQEADVTVLITFSVDKDM